MMTAIVIVTVIAAMMTAVNMSLNALLAARQSLLMNAQLKRAALNVLPAVNILNLSFHVIVKRILTKNN